MKVFNMARTKSEPVDPWADNTFKSQTKISCKKHAYWATFNIWEPWYQG